MRKTSRRDHSDEPGHPGAKGKRSGGSKGPSHISVNFVLLAYFETFVVLGGAYLASQTEAYPWMDIIRRQKPREPIV